MKGYITGAGSALLALLIAPEHPLLAIAAAGVATVVVLAFWTGLVRVEWTVRHPGK